MKKKSGLLSIFLVMLLLLCACSSGATAEGQPADTGTAADVPKEDMLNGIYTVYGIFSNNKFVKVEDYDALQSLYSGVMYIMEDDGTFTYNNGFMYEGEYSVLSKDSDELSYLLTIKNRLELEGTEFVAKDTEQSQYVFELIDGEDFAAVTKYDPLTGHAMASEEPKIFAKSGVPDKDSSKETASTHTDSPAPAQTTTFTNAFGTPTTKCAHSGCNNYIASSGDTNCCTTHSNKCLNCGKYIDEDAMYCMECLTGSANKTSTFTNAYGTPTTKCAHSGCNNYIASSGDTNCCTVHSNKCLNCGKYIDEDAMYCMACLSGSNNKTTNNNKSDNSNKSSGSKCQYIDANGNQSCSNSAMPGGSLCEYHYNYLMNIYNGLTGN